MSLHLITGYAGAEHIQSQDQGSFNIAAFGGGQYVLDHGNKFEASLLAGNTIRIKDGDMMMQGRHIRLAAGTVEELTIENGSQGMLRNDLIVARYTKNNSTGVENVSFVVIKGTEAASSPTDPEYNTGNITDGNDLINDFLLYRVSLNGIDLTLSAPLFNVRQGINAEVSGIKTSIGNIESNIENIVSGAMAVGNATHASSADSATHASSADSAAAAGTAASANNCLGNAASADKLKTARKINNVDFDGSENITIYDNTKLPLDSDFILVNKQTLSFTNNVYEKLDSRITANSLADVYFTSNCMAAAAKADITVETTAGKVTLTAKRTPSITLTASIHIRVV